MKLSVRAQVLAGFGAAILLLVFLGVIAHWSATATLAEIASVRATRAELDATRELMQQVERLQSGTRGFVITGRDEFLAPHDSAARYLPLVLARLRTLSAADPVAHRLADTAAALVARRIAFDDTTIALRRHRGPAAADAVVSAGRGKALMERIQAVTSALEAHITFERVEETSALQAAAARTRLGVVVASLLAILAVGAGIAGIFHELASVERANARVRELADELQDLYHHSPVGHHSLDADGVFIRINDTELRWLGYEREEVVGRLRFADLLAPEERAAFERAFATFKAHGQVLGLAYTLHRKDGTPLPIELSATAVRDASGAYLMSRGVSVDLTERRRIEAQVRTLSGLLPICSGCKKIRDDQGYWNQIETYISRHSEAEFSHGLCPDCWARLYPDMGPYPTG